MAGTCVHLAVAMELNRKFCAEPTLYLGEMGRQYVPELFFAGNICPDGIMARQNYQREMKLHSHLRDGIPDGTFQEPDRLALLRKKSLFWRSILMYYKRLRRMDIPDRNRKCMLCLGEM